MDATHIPDPPVRGVLAWMTRALDHFDLQVYSSRSQTEAGRDAMFSYIAGHAEEAFGPAHILAEGWISPGARYPIKFVSEKPPAFLTIDDRAICFNGDWSAQELDPENLVKFKPWNRR